MTDDLLISLRTFSSCFVVIGAIFIRAIIERTIFPFLGSSPSLIQKVPIETCEWPVLGAFMLKK